MICKMKKITILLTLFVVCASHNSIADLPHKIQASEVSADKLQENFETLDERISQIEAMLAAQQSIIAAFRGECPKGWVEHDQSKGRFLIGLSDTLGVSETGGFENHQLTKEELPSFKLVGSTKKETHSHDVKIQFSIYDGIDNSDNPRAGKTDSGRYTVDAPTTVLLKQNTHLHNVEIASGGSNKPHNNMPPYFVVRWCVPRTK